MTINQLKRLLDEQFPTNWDGEVEIKLATYNQTGDDEDHEYHVEFQDLEEVFYKDAEREATGNRRPDDRRVEFRNMLFSEEELGLGATWKVTTTRGTA